LPGFAVVCRGREIDRGELPGIHAGRQLRIAPDDFKNYLARERAA
jgi:hypothetical protein